MNFTSTSPVLCTYASQLEHIQGLHNDSNSNIMLVFLHRFWEGPMRNHIDEIVRLATEFEDRTYCEGGARTKIELERLKHIRDARELPKYLSCDNEVIRKVAKWKLEELEG